MIRYHGAVRVITIVFVVALAACSKNDGPPRKYPAQLKQEYGAQLQAKLAKIIAANSIQRGTPAAPSPPLELRTAGQVGSATATNAIAVCDTELRETPETTDEHWKHPFGFQPASSDHVFAVRNLLADPPAPQAATEDQVKEFLAARYVLVVSGAEMNGYASGSTFTPGSATGIVKLVDLQAGTWLGEVGFTAQSSGTVVVNSQGAAADDKVKLDLRGNAGKAIAAAIEKQWPGSGVPFGWGY